jgi:enamine deaminase RidA (YjgF/YER057c/UK114 family)
MSSSSESAKTIGQVNYLNPESLHRNPAYTNVVTVSGPLKTVYVGGQNAVDATGTIVGKGDFKAQTEQILKNLQAALEAGGARLEHLIKMTIYVVQGQSLQEGFAAFQKIWGNRANPPTISVLFVAGLAHPDFLAEIDAIAVVPE